MIKLTVCGNNGKMANAIRHLAINDKQFSLTKENTIIDSSQKPEVDVVIDFTSPDASMQHLKRCVELNCPIVIGTTGFSSEQFDLMEEAAKKIPIVFAPNTSLGVNVLYKVLEMASKTLGDDWDISISETHHTQKKDSPSGTALKLGEVITNNSSKTKDKINFESFRVGDVTGEHTVTFATKDEKIEFTHKAQDRVLFAKGAIMAAKWLTGKKKGLYSMQDVISKT